MAVRAAVFTDGHGGDLYGLGDLGDFSGVKPLKAPGQSWARLGASGVDPLPEHWRDEYDLSGRLY